MGNPAEKTTGHPTESLIADYPGIGSRTFFEFFPRSRQAREQMLRRFFQI